MIFVKKVNALVLGLAVLLAFGCGEDGPTDPDPAPQTTAIEKCKFLGAITYDGTDSIETLTMYDLSGRIIKVWGKINGVDNTMYSTYEYGANVGNGVKVRLIMLNQSVYGSERYTYNADSSLVKREDFSNFGAGKLKETYTYEYDNNNKLVKRTIFNASTPTQIDSFVTYTYPAPNTAREQYYADKNGDGILDHLFTTDYTFDDKKSPQRILKAIWSTIFLSGNNPVRRERTDVSGGSPQVRTYFTYEYNTEGFPTKITETSNRGMNRVTRLTYNCN